MYETIKIFFYRAVSKKVKPQLLIYARKTKVELFLGFPKKYGVLFSNFKAVLINYVFRLFIFEYPFVKVCQEF